MEYPIEGEVKPVKVENKWQEWLRKILEFIAYGIWEIPPLSWITRYTAWWLRMMNYMFWSVLYWLPGGNKEEEARKVIEAAQAVGLPVSEEQLLGFRIPEEIKGDPSQVAAFIIEKYLSNPKIREGMEVAGSIIFDAILSVFDYEGPATTDTAKEAARRYMALQTGFTGIGLITDLLTEIPSLGQIDRVGDAVRAMYFATGLNWLPWVMLGPITRASIARPLEQYFQEKFRPEQLSLSQVLSLFASKYLDLPTAVKYLQKLGYKEEDIDVLIASAERDLSLGTIFDAWDKGVLDERQVVARLRRLGYRDEDIPILIATHKMEQQDENVRYYIGSLRKGLREGIVDPSEFRSILKEMGVADEAIDLELELAALDIEEKVRELTTGHIRKAFVEGVITEEEARNALKEAGYSGYAIGILLRTWKAEREPKVLKLNRANIISAYVSGAINERRAREKLAEIGYTSEDIDIIIEDAKLRHPEIPAYPEVRKPPRLPLSVLREAYLEGVIPEEEARQRLADAGWVEQDIGVLIETWRKRKEEEKRELTPSAVERAFKSGVISEEEARRKLEELEFSPDDIDIMISTWINEAGLPIRWPTVAALATALDYGIITPAEVMDSLIKQGYPESVAKMYLAIMLHKPPPGAKPIPRTKVEQAYKMEIITTYEAMDYLLRLGFSMDDAELLLRIVREDVRGGNVVRIYEMGFIDFDTALRALIALGVPEPEARFYLETGGKAEWQPE